MKLKEATYFPDAEELTRFGFVEDSMDFINKLIGDDPLKADISDRLKRFGFDAPKMIKLLTTPEIKDVPETAVIIRTEKIKNGGTDENGKPMKDNFMISYKVPRRDSERGIKGVVEKLRNHYIKLFENHIVEGTILNEDDGGDGGAFGDMGENGGSSTFSLGAGGSYPYFDANALGKKKSGKQDEEKSTDFPIMRRDIYKVTESKKKMKRPIGRLTMFITEEQMEQLAKLLKEEAEMDTRFGDFGYDANGFKTSGKDFFKGANDRDDILSRRNPDNKAVGHIGESKSGIHIKKKNKGKFNATKKRTGKSTEELTHSKNPLTRKRAQFALNAAKWNKK